MKNLKLFSILAVLLAAISFTSCNSDSDNGQQLPTKEESSAMLFKVAGHHSCGILFPGDGKKENSTIAKDSIETDFYVSASDSAFTITNFPVSLFSKYIKDETISKEVAVLTNQNLTGKLLPYDYATTLFGSYTNNIKYTNAAGKEVQLALYGGYNSYSLAGYATNQTTKKQSFMMYLTLGAVYVDGKLQSDVLNTYSSYYGTAPYTVYLQYML